MSLTRAEDEPRIAAVGRYSRRAFERRGRRQAGHVVATHYSRRDYWTRRLLAAADATALLLALFLSDVAAGSDNVGKTMLWGLLVLPAWAALFKAYGLYDRDGKRVSHSTVDDIPWVFHAVLVGVLLLWLYFKIVTGTHLILVESVLLGAMTLCATVLLRGVVRGSIARFLSGERVLVVGEGPMTEVLTRKMRGHPEYGLDAVGLVTVNGGLAGGYLPVLGTLDDLPSAVIEHDIDRIVVSTSALDEEGKLALLRQCRELLLKVSLLPQVFDALGPSVEVDDVEGVTLFGINPPVLARSSRFLKRTLDIVGSLVLLLITAPLMLSTALAIKVDSRGPVFFRQARVGKSGRPFSLLKFRTMVVDAEERAAELWKHSKDPHWLHLDRDPRLTRIGSWLRKFSLDELPQLWNVLRGEMSLVGPRPLVESEDRRIDGWGRSRLALTPGITGSWQVLGRTSIPFEEMVKLDYLYVTNWSLWTDLRLVLRTVPVVFSRKGAN